MAKSYTDEDRVEALAQLEASGGHLRATERETGVAVATLSAMRDHARDAEHKTPHVRAPGPLPDYAALWGAVQERALAIVRANLERFETMELSVSQTKDVQVMAAIASDKHLDHRDGRKGALLLDNSQHLTLPPGTTLDDLRALRDDLRAQAALDAPAETPGYVA